MSTVSQDIALLQRFSREGDEEAFAEIVRRYAAMVFGAGYRVLTDRARAEEVAQETFLRLARKPYTVSQSVGGWLHRTATQLALDACRSDSARRRREAGYARRNREAGAAPRWADVSPLVDAALDELPGASRRLLIEHFMEGRRQQDMAVERGVSPATICRQIQSALGELRARLAKRGVWSAGGVLSLWLACHLQVTAPPSLMRALGKLAMVSADARIPPASADNGLSWSETWAAARRMLPLLMQIVLLAVLVSLMTFSMLRGWSTLRRPPPPHEADRPASPTMDTHTP